MHSFEQVLKNKCGYTGASPYWDWTIGRFRSSSRTFKNSRFVDAPNFLESSFWKDSNPQSGLGGSGDPKADYGVPDGGFRNLRPSYPSPHAMRRNFTLQPFGDLPPPINMFFTEPLKKANTSFLASVIEKILETSTGDYKGFQAPFEAFEVRKKVTDCRIPDSKCCIRAHTAPYT